MNKAYLVLPIFLALFVLRVQGNMVDHYFVLLYLGIQLENNLLELPQRVLKILEILDMPYS